MARLAVLVACCLFCTISAFFSGIFFIVGANGCTEHSESRPFEFSGKVADAETGTPLEGVTVTFAGFGRYFDPPAATTNADGKFESTIEFSKRAFIPNLPYWCLILSKDGYVDMKLEVSPSRVPNDRAINQIGIAANMIKKQPR
jgi:hypothetical protein